MSLIGVLRLHGFQRKPVPGTLQDSVLKRVFKAGDIPAFIEVVALEMSISPDQMRDETVVVSLSDDMVLSCSFSETNYSLRIPVREDAQSVVDLLDLFGITLNAELFSHECA